MEEIINRVFLQKLRDTALAMATNNLNVDFARAYIELGLALDRLDAMHARLELDSQGSRKSVLDNPKTGD